MSSVPNIALSDHLASERADAIRLMLATPLLDSIADPDGFRVVVRHGPWLAEWFDNACGWAVVVDPAAGFARLAKRSAAIDITRPVRRSRGTAAAFDRRRYQLLCLVCAELVRHPVTTIGLLAASVAAEADLDSSRHRERTAFVDALKVLMTWGALRATAGDVDAFVASQAGNAILTADTSRLHRLTATATAPSTLADDLDIHEAAEALLVEPRYGDAATDPDGAEEEQRLRWVRHTVARRVLDDPVAYFDDMTQAERDYLGNPSGRRWLRERVAECGLELEERAEGVLAVDPDGVATDQQFPGPHGNAHQLALLLVDLLTSVRGGERVLGRLSAGELAREVYRILERFPGWARTHRDGDGPDRLTADAIDLLVAFGLAQREADGSVAARPALARYRVGEPTVSQSAPNLFEEV
jgi:uncharacterized protein (TIGR02678 family)